MLRTWLNVVVLSALCTAPLLTLPGPAWAQGTPVDVFNSVSYGRRGQDIDFDAPVPSVFPSGDLILTLLRRNDWNISKWRLEEKTHGLVALDNSFVSMTAFDPTLQQLVDYFCVGSEINVGVPAGWSFSSAYVRYWTDHSPQDMNAWKAVPLTEAGSWSKTDTESWTVGGNVGFFGDTLTGGINADYSFATSKSIALNGITVQKYWRVHGDDFAWKFQNMTGDQSPAGRRDSPALTFFDQFMYKANSELIRQRPEFYGDPLWARTSSRGPAPAFTERDHLPGILIHVQVRLMLQSGGRRYITWESPVADFVVPFAPLPVIGAPPKGHIGVFNDGESPYYKVEKSGELRAIVQAGESDPAQWAENGEKRDPTIDARFAVQKWNTYCDPTKKGEPTQDPKSKKATCLSSGWDWVTPGRVGDLGNTDTVQATARLAMPGFQGGLVPVVVRSVRLTRDSNQETDSDTDSDYHLIPTSVLFDLLLKGFVKGNLSEATQDWLKETGWHYQIWMNDNFSRYQEVWHAPTD